MTRANLLLSSVLAATAFAVGCEWTSSDGITWDDNYNNVNFSGTYPIGKIEIPATETESTETEAAPTSTVTEKTATDNFSNVSSGTVKHTPLLADSAYSMSVTYIKSYKMDGDIKETGSATLGAALGETAGSGVTGVVYANGSWGVSVPDPENLDKAQKAGKVKSAVQSVSISYTYTVGGTIAPTIEGKESNAQISSVTVHQTGQNITLTMNNGSTFSGKISGFNTDADSIQTASTVIAKYNVSGKDGSITGTLNSGTATRTIDGVWSNKGKSWSFSGSCAGAGRSVNSSVQSE